MNKHLIEKPPRSIIKRIMKVGIIVLFAMGCAFFLFVNLVNLPNKNRIDKTNQEKCEKIITALFVYHQDNGRYPESLDKLMPQYLLKVPLEIMHDGDTGRPFNYAVENDGRIFSLKYNEAPLGILPSDSYFEYRSDTASWTQELWQ